MDSVLPRIAFSVVGFDNAQEVSSWVASLVELDGVQQFDIEVLITVNRGDPRSFEMKESSIPVTVVDAGENLGYLGACRLGLEGYVQRCGVPDWCCVSNTDITLDRRLLSLFDHDLDGVGQLSPLVVTDTGVLQNPHLRKRPSARSMRRLLRIHRFPMLGALYIGAAMLKSSGTPNRTRPPPVRLDIYSAHGSCFFLSRDFFTRGGTLEGAPLLYSEELFIGEQLRRTGLRSVCDASVSVEHRSHGTTGLLSLRRVSRLTRDANRMIYKRYFTRSSESDGIE